MKVAAAVISYNAEDRIGALLDSLHNQVDVIVVGIDSKTTDKTRAIAERYKKVKTFDFVIEDDPTNKDTRNFARARNESFAQVPDDVDWILWIDDDDVLESDIPLRELCAEQPPDRGMIWLPYIYHRSPEGHATTVFDRERVIRKAFHPIWKSRLHETVETRTPSSNVRDERVWIEQKNRHEGGKSDRNFGTLKLMIEEDPNDHRAKLYLAHQYFAAGEWLEATRWYETFIRIKSPGDEPHEKWQALIYLAKARREAGNPDGAIQAANAALAQFPEFADSYFELSHCYAVKAMWEKSIEWFELGVPRERPDRILIQNPLDYELNPYAVVHTAYYMQKDYDKAITAVTQCLKLKPNDPEFRFKGRWYVASKRRDEAALAGMQLASYLLSVNESLKAEQVLKALPAGAGEDMPGPMEQAQKEIGGALQHLRDEVEYENFYVASEEKMQPSPDMISKVPVLYPRMQWVVDRLKRSGCKRVLEIGVGNAMMSMWMATQGIQVVGLEVDPLRVKQANFNAVKFGFLKKRYSKAHRKTLPVIRPDALAQFHYVPPVASIYETVTNRKYGEFDAIIATEIIEHLEDPEKFLADLERFGKRIIVSTPNGAYRGQIDRNPGHVRAWSRLELETFFSRRGRLIESHLLAHPVLDQDNLAIEYIPGESMLDRPPVAIFCGPGVEAWSPDQVNAKGLGGSETAVVEVARELAAKGVRVTVYAEAEGVWDGVLYRKYTKWRANTPVWVFIAWRNPALFDQPIAANLKWLWMHDLDAPITEERMRSVDTVLCMSKFHESQLREKYPFLDDKLLVVGNGLRPERFEFSGVEKDKHRFVYTSSPDRGLEPALQLWPKIRDAIPEAELYVYYGWENFDRMGGSRAFKEHIKELLAQPGVHWKGRVGQQELARELQQASVLLYPGPHPFEETFCINVLEAQAAGCVPVTRDNGSLPEINVMGRIVPNDAEADEWIRHIKEAVKYDRYRGRMSDWAKTQTWEAVAKRFIKRAMDLTQSQMKDEAIAS